MIKKLASCIGQYKKETILTPVFVGVECAFEVLIPLKVKDWELRQATDSMLLPEAFW